MYSSQPCKRRGAWPEIFAPLALIALCLIPTAAGVHRLLQLAVLAAPGADSARFVAAPLPLVLHILSALLFGLLGAVQFSRTVRRRRPHLHRLGGRVMVTSGLLAAASALWMTRFYAAAPFDGAALHAIRLLAAAAMALCVCLGVAAVLRKNLRQHRAWMMRGYALGLGAGTQVVTHIPWFLFPGIQGELARTLCMSAGWTINLAVSEWLIRRRRSGL